MSRKRSRYRPRTVAVNTLQLAIAGASRYTEAEIAETIQPARELARAFREGVATETQYHELRSMTTIALAIEGSGIIRGLQAHFLACIRALDALAARARAHGAWQPRALRFDELDAINTAVDLHEEQLRYLSASELHRIVRRLVDQARTAGDAVVVVNERPPAAAPHHHPAAHDAPHAREEVPA